MLTCYLADAQGKPVAGLDFSPDGAHVAVTRDDQSISLFHVDTAALKKTLFCKARGAGLLRYTHHSQSVLLSSKNAQNDGTSVSA